MRRVDHAAQFGAQTLDLVKFLLHAVEERRLRFDAFVNQKCGGFGARAEDARLHEILQLLLRLVRDFDGDDVIVLRGNGALDGAADVAPNGRE